MENRCPCCGSRGYEVVESESSPDWDWKFCKCPSCEAEWTFHDTERYGQWIDVDYDEEGIA